MGRLRTVNRPAYKGMVRDLEKSQEKISQVNDKLEVENQGLRKENAHLREIVKSFLATDAGVDTILTHVRFGE